MQYIAEILVKIKDTVFSPQSSTIENLINRDGVHSVEKVKTGKFYELKLNEKSLSAAEKSAKVIAENILTNPILEEYQILSVKEK